MEIKTRKKLFYYIINLIKHLITKENSRQGAQLVRFKYQILTAGHDHILEFDN